MAFLSASADGSRPFRVCAPAGVSGVSVLPTPTFTPFTVRLVPARGPPCRFPSGRSSPVASKKLPIQKRKDIFLALVAAQDTHTMTVGDTQRQIQMDFAITESQLEEIIEEGVEKEWLDEFAAA